MLLSLIAGARKFAIIGAVSVGLSGCGALWALNPPGIPGDNDLEGYATTSFGVPLRSAHPYEQFLIGAAYVDENCSTFFDSVEQSHRKLNVSRSVLMTTSTQFATLMQVAKRSALSIARVAAAMEITKVLLEQYDKEFTFAPHSVELRALVFDALNKQKNDILAKPPRSQIEAISIIKKYAEICTLGRIHEYWNGALAKAVRDGVVSSDRRPVNTTLSAAAALGPPRSSSPASLNRYVVK